MKKAISAILLFLLFIRCAEDKKDFQFYQTLFALYNHDNLLHILRDYKVHELYDSLMLECDVSYSASYSGSCILYYNVNNEEIVFDSINNICLELLGVICPSSMLDAFYYEMNIDYNSNSLSFDSIMQHIVKSDGEWYALFNIIVPDSILLSNLSPHIATIIRAYDQVYNDYQEARFTEQISQEEQIIVINDFRKMYPLRIRITPQTHYGKIKSLIKNN